MKSGAICDLAGAGAGQWQLLSYQLLARSPAHAHQNGHATVPTSSSSSSNGTSSITTAIQSCTLQNPTTTVAAAATDMDQDGCSSSEGNPLHVGLSRALEGVAAAAEGLSGRSLRKLPFLAHANDELLPTPCSCAAFLQALHAAALKEQEDRQNLAEG